MFAKLTIEKLDDAVGRDRESGAEGKHRKLSGKRTDSGQNSEKLFNYSTEEAIPSASGGIASSVLL